MSEESQEFDNDIRKKNKELRDQESFSEEDELMRQAEEDAMEAEAEAEQEAKDRDDFEENQARRL